jgi:DNA-binding MarR family transcriptional regulator
MELADASANQKPPSHYVSGEALRQLQLGYVQEAILTFLAYRPAATTAAIAGALGRCPSAISDSLRGLKARALIKPDAWPGTKTYELTPYGLAVRLALPIATTTDRAPGDDDA